MKPPAKGVGMAEGARQVMEFTAPAEGLAALSTRFGHFADGGATYVITDPLTPRPWVNVISNGVYGLVISQMGGGFSWWENANLARLTSWQQDLVRDESGRFLYIRDDESGQVWSAALNPVGGAYDAYEVRHGVGWTAFTHRRHDIEVRWTLTVPPEESCELWLLEVRNCGARPRKISVFSYLEWCLGNGADWHREFQKTFIETRFDPKLRALIGAKRRMPLPKTVSPVAGEIPLSGFLAVNRPVISHCGDKERFLGGYRSVREPRAVLDGRLCGTTGRWGDSIAALHISFELAPSAEDSAVFILGKYDDPEAAETVIHRYSSRGAFQSAMEGVQALWRPTLDGARVATPDPAFDLMTNTWLKYQALSARLWGKVGYYQSSAAFGYRDQLQDSQLFLSIDPERTKRQILLHAAHQHRDGTVLHWWYPIVEQGPLSHHSDTPLWLVYVTLSYLEETADWQILREKAPFLDGPAKPLFEHCAASLELSLKSFSKRGLPLILSGDWNDGMSFVGIRGKGESIWLAHFLADILTRWASALERLTAEGETIRGATKQKLAAMRRRYQQRADRLKEAVNKLGWDGQWYWRATCDDGTVLGSRKSAEGKIYLNAQTWAVIAGTAAPKRATAAMDAAQKHLNREYGPLLFTPAYTSPSESIGYLTRYAPGVRENGGVYSHAATWAIIAECKLGRGDLAYDIYSKICPANRGMQPERYAGEPYVMPGNTDGPESPYFGRAGWTWYTGSAAWLYRAATEWILGVRPTWDGLLVDPCVPKAWKRFQICRRFRGTTYRIMIENPHGLNKGRVEIRLDGKPFQGNVLPVCGDGQEHEVRGVMQPLRPAKA